MKLCSGCLQKADLKVEYPQLLKPKDGCDKCYDWKKSYDIADVVKQLLEKDYVDTYK